jgi:hypothetical protein
MTSSRSSKRPSAPTALCTSRSTRVLGSNGAENRSKEPSGFLTGPWNDGGS